MPVPILGIMGTEQPVAATPVPLYTAPPSRQAVISTLTVAEVGGAEAAIRIYAVEESGTPSDANAIAYDLYLPANTHYGFTEGIALSPGQAVHVESDTGDVTFIAFGNETDVPA